MNQLLAATKAGWPARVPLRKLRGRSPGLLVADDEIGTNILRGVSRPVERQNAVGAWDETAFTGCGFPNHLYMRYHLYPHYFPVLALAHFKQRVVERTDCAAPPTQDGTIARMRRSPSRTLWKRLAKPRPDLSIK